MSGISNDQHFFLLGRLESQAFKDQIVDFFVLFLKTYLYPPPPPHDRLPLDSHTVINIGLLKVMAGKTLVARLSGFFGVSRGIRVLGTFPLFLGTFPYTFPHQHPKDGSLEKWLCL